MHLQAYNRLNKDQSNANTGRHQRQPQHSQEQSYPSQRQPHTQQNSHQQYPSQQHAARQPYQQQRPSPNSQYNQPQQYGNGQPRQPYNPQTTNQQGNSGQPRGGSSYHQQNTYQNQPGKSQWRSKPTQPPFRAGSEQPSDAPQQFGHGNRQFSPHSNTQFQDSSGGGQYPPRRNPRYQNNQQEQLMALAHTLLASQKRYNPRRESNQATMRRPNDYRNGRPTQRRQDNNNPIDRRQPRPNGRQPQNDYNNQRGGRRERDRPRNKRDRQREEDQEEVEEELNEPDHHKDEDMSDEDQEQQQDADGEEEEVDEEQNEEEIQDQDQEQEPIQEPKRPEPRHQQPKLAQKTTPVLNRPEKKLVYKPVPSVKQVSNREEEETSGLEKCSKMCPDQEFQDRLQIFRQMNSAGQTLRLDSDNCFSFFEIGRISHQPDNRLTLKRFKRAANNEQGESSVVRIPSALKETMEHILKYIVDADSIPSDTLPFMQPVDKVGISFEDIYSFLWNRIRAMIKEISQLTPTQQRSESIVTVSEQIARFFVMSINQMRQFPGFEEQLNKKNLEKILTQLLETYRYSKEELKRLLIELKQTGRTAMTNEQILQEMQRRNIYISPHEPEISGYAMVFSSRQNIYLHLGNMNNDLKELQVNPILESRQMKRALDMLTTINDKNIAKYFRGIDSDRTGYLLACTMLFHLNDMRKETVNRITKACREGDGDSTKDTISLQVLDMWLQFNGDGQELMKFLKHIGSVFTMDEQAIVKNTRCEPDGRHYCTPFYQFDNKKLNRQRLGVPANSKHNDRPTLCREEIIKGLSMPKSNYDNNLIELLKSHLWGRQCTYEQQDNSLSIVEQMSTQGKKEDKPVIGVPSVTTSQDRAALREKIKRNKHQKFLDSFKTKILGYFREAFRRKKVQQDQFNRMFHILSINMDRQQEIGFRKIKAMSEYKSILQKSFRDFREVCQRQKAFANEIISPNEYTLLKGRRTLRHSSKSSSYMMNSEMQEEMGDDDEQSDTIMPINQDLETFDQKCRSEGFFESVCRMYLKLPEEIFTRYSEFNLRIMVIIDNQYIENVSVVRVMTGLVKYLTKLNGVEQFDEFINISHLQQSTFEECLTFMSSLHKKDKQTRINYTVDYYKYASEEELHRLLDEEMYGANVLLLPITTNQISKKFDAMTKTIKKIDENLWRIPVIVLRLYYDKATELASNPRLAIPIASTITFTSQSTTSMTLDNACKQAILQSLDTSIRVMPEPEAIRRFSLVRFLGEIRENMKYVANQVKKPALKFFYYQEYINACFRSLNMAASEVFERRYTLDSWAYDIRSLRRGYLTEEANHDRTESINDLTQRETTFTEILFSNLDMNFIDKEYFIKTNKLQFLVTQIMCYLDPLISPTKKRLERDIAKFANKIRSVCFINEDQLPDGNIQELFTCIINTIIENLHTTTEDCELIVPNNFLFKIGSDELDTEVQQKYKTILLQLSRRNAKLTNKDLIRERFAKIRESPKQIIMPENFHYSRQAMYDMYMSKLDNHQNETATNIALGLSPTL